MSRPRVLVACVAEDRPDWHRMVENLAVSLRNFGGQLADARLVVHFVGTTDPPALPVLRELGVEVRSVPPYPSSQPTTNKLRMFEAFSEDDSSEFFLALDCDTVVVGDLLDVAETDALCAVPARTSPLTAAEWRGLLADLELPTAFEPTVMYETLEPVPAPYVNSGVLLIPSNLVSPLTAAWKKYVDRFSSEAEAGVDRPWTGYMMDQVALACALLEVRSPLRTLGLEVNLSTALNDQARRERWLALTGGDGAGPRADRVRLLHYHRHISPEGRLLRTDRGSPLNAVIDRVNAVLDARLARGARISGGLATGRRLVTAAARRISGQMLL